MVGISERFLFLDLTLVGRAGAVPEEGPLQALVALELVFEAEGVVLVGCFEEVEHFGGGLHDWEWRVLGVVDQDGDAACLVRRLAMGLFVSREWKWRRAVRVETEEPLLLLLVGHDVDERGGPFRAVGILELLEQDLDGLAVGRVHCDEVKAFGVLHLGGRLAGVELVCHC